MHGDIERGGRLVGDDEARIARKGHGDQHALAHAAGQLMRILRQQLRGARQPRGRQHGDGALARAVPRRAAEPRQMLVELRADGEHRIERGHRRLRDEGDGAAEQRTPRAPAPCARDPRRRTAAIPTVTAKPAGKSCAMARPTMDLPAPDSPTRPRIFPGARSNDRSRITGTMAPSMPGADRQLLGLQRQHGVSARFPQAARRACGASRRPSRLNAVTAKKIAKIGSSRFHGD